ncbi:hypothetical protein I4N56_014275 [Pseudomonas mohnii]|uniref:gp53-like domain-containing protein n=1 Tax=Pseudomonas mohnii TaxID=395600 RepID=UPI0018DBA296|nr:hypothetical protein [Pseudomonas mohnii]MBH8611966.1 hypothetical protein [Pseudomonas mohnii]
MADLPELDEWTTGVYQIETSDPVLGGPEGISNQQAKQLASRTRWLKGKIEALIDGTVSAAKAVRLATARTISISGAGTGSASFDGSANAAIALTLADSGVAAGSYPKVTVTAKGLVTGGGALGAADIPALAWSKITTGKPTTLDGYGITDALPGNGNAVSATKLATARTLSISGAGTGSASFDGAANAEIALTLANSGVTAGSYAKVTVSAKGLVTAGGGLAAGDMPVLDWSKITTGKPTTLAGYGISDAAPLDSPNFKGIPLVPTAPAGNNTQQAANTAFIQAALAALVDSSPAALDTLKELATALGNDPNFAATVTNALSLKAPLASPAFTGAPTVPTQAAADNSTKAANTAQVQAAILAALSGRVLNSVGYQKLPGGLVVQWGDVNVSVVGGSYQAFSFPLRFPVGCFVAIGGRKALGSNAVMLVGQSGGDPSGQVIFQNYAASPEIGQYIAIGY